MTGSNGCAHHISENISSALALEAHHRIKNSLALVSAIVRLQEKYVVRQGELISTNDVLEMLRALGAKIDAVSIFHELLSNEPNKTSVNLADHLGTIFGRLVGSQLFTKQYKLIEHYAPDCSIPMEQVVPLTLFLIEAVTNAVKYAHPTGVQGIIQLSCLRRRDGTIVVEVADDGIGFPEDFDPATDGGVGFKVLRGLVQQLDGTFVATSTPLGVNLQIHLPKGAR